MKGFTLVLRAAVAAILVAFLVFAPPYLERALGRNYYREWLSGKKEAWSGVITVWHVVGFKTCQGSITSYLENVASQYERAHAGVYIEVLGLTAEAVQERLSRGERPDAWSFPMGELEAEQFAPLSLMLPAFAGNILPLSSEGTAYAVPYLYSGYFLLGNTVLVQELGLSWPESGAAAPVKAGEPSALADTLQTAMDSRSTTRYGALCAPPIIAARMGLTGKMAQEGDFKAGQVPFMIGDGRTFGDLSRKMASGGFTFDALPLGGFTEQVQYIGIDVGAQGGFAEHTAGLITLLLGEQSQAKATALGALPAVAHTEDLHYADGQLQIFYDAYRAPVCPLPALWQQHYDALLREAQTALTGDSAGKHAFYARMEQAMGDTTQNVQ